MAYDFPKRIIEEGAETQIDKINNTCRRAIMDILKHALKDEYEEVLKDLIFSPILAINDNKLVFSGKIIHSFICKQLKVSKLHELWFVFARRPLRFSIQEFHDVTGLKCKEEPDMEFNNWKDDKGFWSKVLRQNGNINLLSVRKVHIKDCNKWSYVDMLRLVYMCIIHGFIIAKDEKVHIPQAYICLVMDFDKMRMNLWGLRAYDELIASILRARVDLHRKNNYVLDGFSYAFQIWLMEAISDIGTMVGKKLKENITKVRCRNWRGSGKVSYQDIISLESNFYKGEVFPFISAAENFDVIDDSDFFREDEKKDERVACIVDLINAKQDWTNFIWEVEVSAPSVDISDSEEDIEVEDVTETQVEELHVKSMGKRKLNDPGSESQKKQLLYQRAAEHSSGVSGEIKTFIKDLITSSFTVLKEMVHKDIQGHFDKLDNEMAQLKETVSQMTVGDKFRQDKGNASEIPCPSTTMRKVGKENVKASSSAGPSAAKGNRKGKAS